MYKRFGPVCIAGNSVIFSLETASDYVKDEKACFYGFKCMIVGYEWNDAHENVSIQNAQFVAEYKV